MNFDFFSRAKNTFPNLPLPVGYSLSTSSTEGENAHWVEASLANTRTGKPTKWSADFKVIQAPLAPCYKRKEENKEFHGQWGKA